MSACDTLWFNARLASMQPGRSGLGVIARGAVAARAGRIVYAGPQEDAPRARVAHDCGGRWITPGLIDCHTHLVYAGSRAREFEMRRQGASYAEIARAGGGIMGTVAATAAASEAELSAAALRRADGLLRDGVTTVEIKSGYGLSRAAEAKQLRVARGLEQARKLRVRPTYLALHALPVEYAGRANEYVSLVCEEIMPALAGDDLMVAVDAFCESIAFSPAQVARVFAAARGLGLAVKLHAEQLSDQGGAAMAAGFGALSVDHLEYLAERDVPALAQAGTVAVMLPAAFYVLGETQLPPLAALRAHGVALAVASDCNPGTAPLCSLRMAMNMAAILFGMSVEECLLGTTRHAARALGLGGQVGELSPGAACDLAIWDVQDLAELVYEMGNAPLHARVFEGEMA